MRASERETAHRVCINAAGQCSFDKKIEKQYSDDGSRACLPAHTPVHASPAMFEVAACDLQEGETQI